MREALDFLLRRFLSTLSADRRNVPPDAHADSLHDLIDDGADNEPQQRAALADFLLIRDKGEGWDARDYADALCTLFDEMDGKADAVRAACIARATEARDFWHAAAERPDGGMNDRNNAVYLADVVEDLEILVEDMEGR